MWLPSGGCLFTYLCAKPLHHTVSTRCTLNSLSGRIKYMQKPLNSMEHLNASFCVQYIILNGTVPPDKKFRIHEAFAWTNN